MKDASSVPALKEALAGMEKLPEIMVGEEGMVEVARHPEAVTVVTGIVGCAGLKVCICSSLSLQFSNMLFPCIRSPGYLEYHT